MLAMVMVIGGGLVLRASGTYDARDWTRHGRCLGQEETEDSG